MLILNTNLFLQRGYPKKSRQSMQDAIASFTRELTGMKDSQKFLQQSLSSVLPGEFEIFEFDGICCASPILRDFLDLLEIMLG